MSTTDSPTQQVTAVVRNRVQRGQEHVIFATAEQVKDARAWAMDCLWNDSEDLPTLSAQQIVRGVDRHYDGGWDQFVRDGQYDAPRIDLPRDQWGPREWAALDRFMGECWDGRMGQRVD